MARQTEKQKQAARASGRDVVIWQGQLCEIVGNEPVTKSDNSVVLCAKIKVLGMPLHQGLRLVAAEELKLVE
jgi:hypothetical protein